VVLGDFCYCVIEFYHLADVVFVPVHHNDKRFLGVFEQFLLEMEGF
jgi:hypothetical protein